MLNKSNDSTVFNFITFLPLITAVQGSRYPSSGFTTSKQAIQTMLRSRQPGVSGYMPQPMMNSQSIQKQMVRQRLAALQSNRMIDGQAGMYGASNPSSGMMSIGQSKYRSYQPQRWQETANYNWSEKTFCFLPTMLFLIFLLKRDSLNKSSPIGLSSFLSHRLLGRWPASQIMYIQ